MSRLLQILKGVHVLNLAKLLGRLFFMASLLLLGRSTMAQDWFRTGTGLGEAKPRVAISDFAPRSDAAKSHAALFTQVVRDDLQLSGILELASPSFYPPQVTSVPAELKNAAWIDPPTNANFVGFGNLSESTAEVAIEAWLYDVRSPASQAVVGKVYRGAPTDLQVRKFAHQFADEIISKLSGGLPGIASTQIAFVSSRGGSKEIWAMDYDGANQRQLTFLKSISLTPRWSPDASRIAFTCFAPSGGVTSAQICMYSMDTGKLVSFARFRGTNITPAWSPDGTQIIFSSSMQGNPELYVTDVSGGRPKRLTIANGASLSPSWNPKTGQTVAFVSDRGGIPVLYLMNSDGTSTTKLDLPDMGYVIDPAWAPNGQLLAFSWRRPSGNYDIYVMDAAGGNKHKVATGGDNIRPHWSPDGKYLAFSSTRTGKYEVFIADVQGGTVYQVTQTAVPTICTEWGG